MINKTFVKANNYLSLVKFSHTIFSFPFAFIGFFLAIKLFDYKFDYKLLILVALAVLFARNAAMGFNRFVDKEIDKMNPRTALREIPAKILKPKSVLLFVIINSALFILTAFFINMLCFYLSPIALFVVLGYSFTKRFTFLSHLVLGLGLSLAPLGAFLAVTGSFNFLPLCFSFIVMFWVAGFDIIYALQDEGFDKDNKLKSIPAFFGKNKALIISIIFHLCSVIFIIIAGLIGDFGIIYWIGSTIFVGLLFFQHSLVKPNDLKNINLAFFTTNGFASVIFAAFVIGDMYLRI